MSTTTYDPILEVQELRRFRILAPLASPAIGTALVLEPYAGEPLIIKAGERVPEARMGAYRRSFLVDLGQYSLRLEERLPSRDPSFLFPCAVTFSCRVLDPAAVARLNIRDMTAALRLSMVRIMRGVARDYDVSEFNEAEPALNGALEHFRGDRAIELSGFLVEFAPGGEYLDTLRGIRMDDIRRRAMEGVVAGGRETMYAQWLAKHDGDPSELIQYDAESKALESEHLLRAMQIISSSGEKTEAFDTNAERRRLLGRLVSDPGIGAPERSIGGSRRSRLAGSLSSGTPGPRRDESGGDGGTRHDDRPEFLAGREDGPAGRPGPPDRHSDPPAGDSPGHEAGPSPRRGPHEAGEPGRPSRVRASGSRSNSGPRSVDPDAGDR